MADRMFEAFMNSGITRLPAKENNFKSNLETYANGVAQNYIKYGLDMNSSIAKLASRSGLNEDQTKRVIEESNNKVYLIKYAQMKNSNDREVVFDRADMEKVAVLLAGKDSDMSKFASDKSEPLNAYNSTRNLTGAIAPTAPMSLEKIIAEKLASELATVAAETDKAHVEFDAQIYKVAEMLFRYDRSGIDINAAYDTICRSNKFMAPMQKVLQDATNDVISMEKKACKLESTYQLKLPNVDVTVKKDNFTLGSFSKIASMNFKTEPAERFPVLNISGTMVKSVDDMCKVAAQINTLFAAVQEKEQKFAEMEKKATFKKAGE